MTRIQTGIVNAYVFRRTPDGVKYLLLKRNRASNYSHLWQGIAGKIEPGESAWQTAVRELKEETGLDPKIIFTVDHIDHFYEAYNDCLNLVPVFGIEVDSSEITLSREHCESRWVSLDEASTLLIWTGQKTGIGAVNIMLRAGDERIRWATIKPDQSESKDKE